MRSGCFCLRPARDASHVAEVSRPQGQTGLRGPDSSNGAHPGPQPVRAVSPADVRRTASGRVIKQKAEAGLQSIREASTCGVRVIGGRQISPCAILDPQQGRSAAEVQQLSRRPESKRILQPVDVAFTDCKQEKTLLQLLRPSRKSLEPNNTDSEPGPVCKSIMEASERRLHRHKQAVASSAVTQMAVIQSFSDAYLAAVSTGDQQWASAAQIAASFSLDAVLKTQDKQTFHGKQAVLKRLNSGVGMLMKLLGDGNSRNVPSPVMSGPAKIDDKTWCITYIFKHGAMKYAIKSYFMFLGDKIAMIQNVRV